MFVVAGALVLGPNVPAGEKKEEKEVTLKGTITCPKCDLKLQDKCATVFVTKKKDKEIIYFFDAKAHKKYHKDICTEAKKGSVTGVFGKEGKKHVVKVKKVEYDD